MKGGEKPFIMESTIQNALRHIQQNPQAKVSAVAREFGVKRTTLRSRIDGHSSATGKVVSHSRLSTAEEKAVCAYIDRFESTLLFAPSSSHAANCIIKERASRLANPDDIKPIGDHKTAKLEPDTDFFSNGVDSPQVINASSLLRSGLKAVGCEFDETALETRTIYNNPTPRRLAQYILMVVQNGNSGKTKDREECNIKAMKHLRDKYSPSIAYPRPIIAAKIDGSFCQDVGTHVNKVTHSMIQIIKGRR